MNTEERFLFECLIIQGFESRKYNGTIKRSDSMTSKDSINFCVSFNNVNSQKKFFRAYSKINGITIEKTNFFRGYFIKFDLKEAENQLQEYLKNKAQEIYNRLQAS